MLKFTCPHCGTHYSYLESELSAKDGDITTCLNCGKDFTIKLDFSQKNEIKEINRLGLIFISISVICSIIGVFSIPEHLSSSKLISAPDPIISFPEMVETPRGFSIGKYEITHKEFASVMGFDFSLYNDESPNMPVTCVHYSDAEEFCKKLTIAAREKGIIKSDEKYRLPTSEEWEYACRAGERTNRRFGGGETLNYLKTVAWFSENSSGSHHAVGLKEPNSWGIYDMQGNVSEWCSDRRLASVSMSDKEIKKLDSDIRSMFKAGSYNLEKWDKALRNGNLYMNIVRGGNYSQNEEYCRVSKIDFSISEIPFFTIGFRVVLDIAAD
ncbi:MAG: formylglycine-generating enzyme family protein [Opitutales bacterium]|nr:formylglycine-generating enzyme family protein [Opitutales bacterium]